MTIPVYTVEDLKDVRRLPEKIQLISDPDLPVFFFVQSGGSRFFFINLTKFMNSAVNKIAATAIEASGAVGAAGVTYISYGTGDRYFVVP